MDKRKKPQKKIIKQIVINNERDENETPSEEVIYKTIKDKKEGEP